jgi:uncharacterized membrane protein
MKNKKIRLTIFVLLIIVVALTGYMSYNNLSGSDSGFCLVGEEGSSSCSSVQNSIYGSIFGIKVYFLGFIGLSTLLIIYVAANSKNSYQKFLDKIFLKLSFIGTLFAIYFILLQIIILRTICSTCMIIDGTMILVFILGLISKRR